MAIRQYSTLFACLHDEPEAYGDVGRGTHYSIFRALGQKLGPIYDFAVIWDEDHDERVIDVIEEMALSKLISPALFIGERKGSLTVIVSDLMSDNDSFAEYQSQIQRIVDASNIEDYWPVEVHEFSEAYGSIINDAEPVVNAYLNNIINLWKLGAKLKL